MGPEGWHPVTIDMKGRLKLPQAFCDVMAGGLHWLFEKGSPCELRISRGSNEESGIVDGNGRICVPLELREFFSEPTVKVRWRNDGIVVVNSEPFKVGSLPVAPGSL